MNQYFDDNSELKSNQQQITYQLNNQQFQFISDNGVFSKQAIDYGSQVLLETIIKKNEIQNKLLDVGCGYGVIGIILKRFYPDTKVDMVEINPRAMELARINGDMNDSDVHVYLSDIYENVYDHDYTDIVTNPPIRAGKKVVYEIFEKAYDYLLPNGSLWVVIRKQQGAPSAIKKLKEIFGNCEVLNKDKGYYILRSKKKT